MTHLLDFSLHQYVAICYSWLYQKLQNILESKLIALEVIIINDIYGTELHVSALILVLMIHIVSQARLSPAGESGPRDYDPQ